MTALVGSSARHRGEPYTLAEDFDFFVCYDPHAVESSTGHCAIGQVINAQEVPHYATPALAIFGPEQAQRGVVFRTRHAVLTAEECRRVVDTVNRYHDEACDGHWGTVRHSSVKTTDVAVESVPLLREWLLALMHTKTNRMLSFLFPALADGTSMYTNETPSKSRIRIHDAFIVRYDAERDHSLSLPEHCDTSAVSVVVSLNSAAAGDYTGGGTWFEALGEKGKTISFLMRSSLIKPLTALCPLRYRAGGGRRSGTGSGLRGPAQARRLPDHPGRANDTGAVPVCRGLPLRALSDQGPPVQWSLQRRSRWGQHSCHK